MIKRLQFRGMSNTPSDRLVADGGVSNSVNLGVTDREIGPVLPPIDKSESDLCPQPNPLPGYYDTYDALYIHKMGAVENILYVNHSGQSGGSLSSTRVVAYPSKQVLYSLSTDETISREGIVSIGNTLMFATNKGMCYFLYKDNEYKYLGRNLPQPDVLIEPVIFKDQAYNVINIIKEDVSTDANWIYLAKSAEWRRELAKEKSERSDPYNNVVANLWTGFQKGLLGSTYFRYPIYVRFALTLYDGTVVCHTVPVYLRGGVGIRDFDVQLVYDKSFKQTKAIFKQGNDSYKIRIQLLNASAYEGWEDVITSIDMYISGPCLYPSVNAEIVGVADTVETDTSNSMTLYLTAEQGTQEETDAQKDALLQGARLMYKVKTYQTDSLTSLSSGEVISNTHEYSYMEQLATEETLKDDFRSNNSYIAGRSYVFNNRLLSLQVKEIFGRGESRQYNRVPTTDISAGTNLALYSILYEIKDSNGVSIVKGNTFTEANDGMLDVYGTGNALRHYYSDAMQMLYYPDSRCVAAYITRADGKTAKVEMTSHPYINCAYWIGDMSKTLSSLTFTTQTLPEESNLGLSYNDSYLFHSPVNNPFIYPASGRIRFSANLIAVATISSALSEGQFGQFDLYVFTDDGIKVLTPNSEGDYTRITPLSRDICTSADAVVSIDQAIVFVSPKGVMLLSGSRLQNLSAEMVGNPEDFDTVMYYILTAQGIGATFRPAILDQTHFMQFMGEAQIGYDYTNARLVFVNNKYNYFYIYNLSAQSWCRYVTKSQEYKNNNTGQGVSIQVITRVLNSYPSCYMWQNGVSNKQNGQLLCWSSHQYDFDKSTLYSGLLVSRPFSLDNEDVLKTISQIKLRGNYARLGNDGKPRVTYILTGSQDGVNWSRILSLRGKSWKYFRILVITKLSVYERLSWVDIKYDLKFNNKVR